MSGEERRVVILTSEQTEWIVHTVEWVESCGVPRQEFMRDALREASLVDVLAAGGWTTRQVFAAAFTHADLYTLACSIDSMIGIGSLARPLREAVLGAMEDVEAAAGGGAA